MVTNIVNEDKFLLASELAVAKWDVSLAHQIGIYQMEKGCFNDHHLHQFKLIAALPGFTGSIVPGESIEQQPVLVNMMDVDIPILTCEPEMGSGDIHVGDMREHADREQEWANLEDEEDAEDELQGLGLDLYHVLTIASD